MKGLDERTQLMVRVTEKTRRKFDILMIRLGYRNREELVEELLRFYEDMPRSRR